MNKESENFVRTAAEEKYNRYREKVLNQNVALGEKDQNITDGRKGNVKNLAEDYIENQQADVMALMMSDPAIYSMHENLKKQSQQKNKQILLTSFPKRYQELLQKQKTVISLNEKISKLEHEFSERTEKQKQKMDNLIEELNRKDGEIYGLGKKVQEQREMCEEELREEMRRKDEEIYQMRELKHKFEKLKEDYKNNCKVVGELREEEMQKDQQIERLIRKIQEIEGKLEKAHRKILQEKNNKQLDIKQAKEEIQQQYHSISQELKGMQQTIQQLNIKLEFKESLIEVLSTEKETLEEKYDRDYIEKHEEIQKIRQHYLDSLQTIDQLEDDLALQKELRAKDCEVRDGQMAHYKKTVENLTLSYSELAARYEGVEKLLKTKDQTINFLETQVPRLQASLSEKQSEKELISREKQQLSSMLQKQRENSQQIQNQNTNLSEKLLKFQQIFQKQEKTILNLKIKIEEWLEENPTASDASLEVKKYKNMAQRLKKELMQGKNRQKLQIQKQVQMFQSMVLENKQMKKKMLMAGLF